MSPLSFVIAFLAVGTADWAQGQTSLSRDPCLNHHCQNGTTCVSPLDYPICQCPPGFGGGLCENKIPVKPGTCIPISNPDQGTCTRTCDGDNDCPGTQKCCPTFCEKVCSSNITIDPCSGYCQNGGSCTAPADAPICQCPYGFSGKRCEICDRSKTTSCPAVKTTPGGIGGVCGGVFCNKDTDCLSNQRCQKSPCGGYLCTNTGGVPTPVPPTLTCANVLCNVDTVCSYVVTCPRCPIQPACIPATKVRADINAECLRQNFSNVILVDSKTTPYYNQLTCLTGSCPSGSECVSAQGRSSVCCRGKFVPVTKETETRCLSYESFVCGGTFCDNDYDCPRNQKCCSGCGRLCTDPANATNQDLCGNSRCPYGQVCVQKSRTCPPGMACPQVLLPTCVPRGCAKCRYNEECRPSLLGYRCYPPTPVDQCGGCPIGQICKPTNIVCVTTPCPSFKCVPIDKCSGCS